MSSLKEGVPVSEPATENVTFSAALPLRSVLRPREKQVILSPRERQVISLIAAGLSSREIGARLFLAESTVSEHAKGIRAKLRARNRAHAVTIWLHDYPSAVPDIPANGPGGHRRKTGSTAGPSDA